MSELIYAVGNFNGLHMLAMVIFIGYVTRPYWKGEEDADS